MSLTIFSNMISPLGSYFCLQMWWLCDCRSLRWLIIILISIFALFSQTLRKVLMVQSRWGPLFSLLAIFTRDANLHHLSLDRCFVHSILLLFVIEILILLHFTLVSWVTSFLSFQIKRLDNSQLFIVEEDFASGACDLVVEFGHGTGLEEFFGAGVATCADRERTTLLVNDFLSILVQLKTVISCQFLRSLAQHKRLLILGWQLVR